MSAVTKTGYRLFYLLASTIISCVMLLLRGGHRRLLKLLILLTIEGCAGRVRIRDSNLRWLAHLFAVWAEGGRTDLLWWD